jgi:predicted RNase H-like HicB family nuclease
MNMRSITINYRPEGPGWAATSPDAPDYIAYGETLAEALELAHEGIAFHFDLPRSELVILDYLSTPPGVVAANNSTGVLGQAAQVSGALAVGLNVGEVVVRSTAPQSVRSAEMKAEAASAA